MDEVADDEDVAGFASRYTGTLDPRDAVRWAADPLAPALDGSPSPGSLLEDRRRALYRGAVDPDDAARFTADAEAWDVELALARAALIEPVTSSPPAVLAATRGLPPRVAAAAVAVAVAAVVGVGVAVFARSAPPPDPPVAAGVPGVLVAQASAARGPRSGAGLDGAQHFVTIVVTCQGAGAVDVRLSDGTDARFACISAFPRTAVQPSGQRLGRFGYSVRVTGEPNWAMTLSR